MCQGALGAVAKVPTGPSGFVKPACAGRWLEKTRSVAARGRETLTAAVRCLGKHPLQNPTSQRWFALDKLCLVELSAA